MTIPQRFRDGLGEEVVMVSLPGHAIGIIPRALWQQWENELASTEPAEENPDITVILANPAFGRIDSEGRLFLSEALCDWAALFPEAPLLLIGVGQRVEVWSRSVWELHVL